MSRDRLWVKTKAFIKRLDRCSRYDARIKTDLYFVKTYQGGYINKQIFFSTYR